MMSTYTYLNVVSRIYSLDYLLSISSKVPDSVPANICQSICDHDCSELISKYSPHHPKVEPLKPGFFFIKRATYSYDEPERFGMTELSTDLFIMRNRGLVVCSTFFLLKKKKNTLSALEHCLAGG